MISNQPCLNYAMGQKSYFRVSFGLEGPVRNRFAEKEAEELQELIARLDRINFSWVFSEHCWYVNYSINLFLIIAKLILILLLWSTVKCTIHRPQAINTPYNNLWWVWSLLCAAHWLGAKQSKKWSESKEGSWHPKLKAPYRVPPWTSWSIPAQIACTINIKHRVQKVFCQTRLILLQERSCG